MDNLIFLNFQEAKQPTYTEKKGTGIIEFGDKNDYPNYLLDLYNKSAKHNAIIGSKVDYICGNGWEAKDADPNAELFIKQANEYESLADLTKKISTDIEIFGGAYIEVIWSTVGGMISGLYHIDYTKLRTNKDNTQFYYKSDWSNRKEEAKLIPAFNTNVRSGKQILFIKEYRPANPVYSIPGYFGALNYIESDIEISKHTLGNAQTGFSASKLITLPNGEPTDEEKRNIERRFTNRFSGSDGKKFILSFVQDSSRKPLIEDLGASDITKEDFSKVDAMIQQNIFAGHKITNPAIFGISQSGQLGNRSEMRDSYEIFKNTYVNSKQRFIESVINKLAVLKGVTSELYIQPVEPITFEFSEATISQNMTKDEIREKMGLPMLTTEAPTQAQIVSDSINALSPLVANKVLESMTPNEIRALIGLPAQVGGDKVPTASTDTTQTMQTDGSNVNEHLKNLTGRQHQQLLRIIRQFGQGKITREMATALLKSGMGMSDEDITAMLGSDEQFAASISDEELLTMFEAFGEKKSSYTILKSAPIKFNDIRMQFAEDISAVEYHLLELVKKDPLISDENLSKALKITVDELSVLKSGLVEIGALEVTSSGELKTIKPLSEYTKPKVSFEVRYSYEWRTDVNIDHNKSKSRAFCQKLMSQDRLYSRKEIETLSAIVGYSVFDRAGGWWTMPNGDHSPKCRHTWKSNLVVKKFK